jgi:hypothetical protein
VCRQKDTLSSFVEIGGDGKPLDWQTFSVCVADGVQLRRACAGSAQNEREKAPRLADSAGEVVPNRIPGTGLRE